MSKYDNYEKFVTVSDNLILLEPAFLHDLNINSKILCISLHPTIHNLSEEYYKQDLCKKDNNFSNENKSNRVIEISKSEFKKFLKNENLRDYGLFNQIKKYYAETTNEQINLEHSFLFHLRGNAQSKIFRMLKLNKNHLDLDSAESYNLKYSLNYFKMLINFLTEIKLIIFNDSISSEIVNSNFEIYYDYDLHINYIFFQDRKIFLLFNGIKGNTYLDNIYNERLIKLLNYAKQ